SDSLHHAKAPVKKYDWTYSTTYSGTLKNSPYGEFEPTEDHINYDKLKIPEPILFFDETVLYEDELADNGVSITSVKVRFLMRVDGVAFRLFDTRVYHEFGKNYLMRECLARECAYKDIVKLLPKGKGRDSSPDISNLGDPAWVANAIASQPPALETSKNASPFVQDRAEKLRVF
ncbi:Tap42 interacting protein, partial [Tieghemiomyces parasiticus]